MDSQCILKKLNVDDSKQIALAADLSLFFDVALEAFGKHCLKHNTFSKLLETKSFYDSCDIWGIRNPTKYSYTFRQRRFYVSYQAAFDSLSKTLSW